MAADPVRREGEQPHDTGLAADEGTYDTAIGPEVAEEDERRLAAEERDALAAQRAVEHDERLHEAAEEVAVPRYDAVTGVGEGLGEALAAEMPHPEAEARGDAPARRTATEHHEPDTE